MTWKKRIISIALCLCALLCAASVRAEAADHTDHPICGGTTCNHTGENHSTGVSWQAWDGKSEITYTNNVAYIYLSDDVTLQINNDWNKPKSLDVGNGKTLYLCLNGHSLTNRGSNTICVYGTLVLCDCKGGGQNNGTITHTKDTDGSFTGSEGIHVDSGAAFIMYGGTISGNNGGVQVYESTFTMYGGKISGNADRGVDVYGGTFTMYGGEITDNTFIDSSTSNFGGGAGVRVRDSDTVQGNFAMYGGEISNNTYKGVGDGGGVYARGTGKFIIQDGKITDNHCITTLAGAFGGGLYISDAHSELRIENSTISNNTCDGNGGGIFIINNVTGSITNCTISNNSATGASSKGGGLAFDTATVTITGGSITDNKTMGKGGGMAVGSWGDDSKITLSGSMNFSGNAQGCTADENGKLTGDTANDVHLNTSRVYLRLASDFSKTSGAIVVTTSSEPTNKTVKIAEDKRPTPNATDFTYGNNSNIGIIAKTKADGTTVELLACKHNYSQKTDSDNHWQECSICGDIKGVTAHSGGEASCTEKAVCQVCHQPYGGYAAHDYDTTTWVKIDDGHHGHKCNNCNAIDATSKASHIWDDGEVTTPATCTADGERTYTCTACSATKKETIPTTGHAWDTEWSKDNDHHWHKCKNANCTEIADQAGHTWDEGKVTTPATCTTVGEKTFTCAVCSATKTETIGASGHTWGTDWVKDDSDKAHHWHECTKCHEKKDLTEHDWDEGTVTTPATCTTPGVKTFSCGTCSATKTETIGASGHTWGTDWVKDDSDKAHHWHECTKCHEKKDLTEHDWDEGTVTTPATCTTPGVKTFTCGTCNAKKTEEIPASGHDFSVRRYDENNHWLKCSRCDATDTKEAHSGGEATCTQKAVCEKCGQKYGDLKAHDFANGPYRYDGQQHWKKCANCDATNTKVDHSGGTASCTEKAKCEVCGQEYGDLKAHDFANGPYRYDGQQHWKKCANCGATNTKVDHSGGTATCTKKAECEVCGQEHGEKLAHSYTVLVYNETQHWYKCANCDATNTKVDHSGGEASCTKKAVCRVCNQPYGELAAHVYDMTTWVSDANSHWHKCKNCNAIDESTKAPHSWDNVEVTTPATCTAAGVKTYTCTACSATKKETIPATGHTPDAAVRENIVAATCTTAGSYDEVVYCMACGNEVSRTQKTIDKLAHDYDTTTWVKADENQHGHKCKNCDAITDLTAHVPGAAATETTPQLCTECGYVIAPATHPVHTWVFVAETPATCNATGVKEHYKCDCRRKSVTDGVYDIVSDTELILAINPANHTGAPDSKWHSDSANHWQEYTCCHARANEAAHSGGAATCTAQAVCQVCGKAYGPLAAHDWGAWKVTAPATKDAPGVETRTCTYNSAHTETRSIPKLSTTVYTVSEDTKIAQIEAKVDGLDKILESDENKALVNDGKSVGVSLTVKNTASSGVSEKIKEKLAGSNLVGLRLELTVEKTVTANGVVESKQTIPDAGVLLKTTITLPAELQGKSGYVVYRLHDGNVHVLTETANENGEFISVSADKTQITIWARLYSEYVIAYQAGGSSGGGYHPVNPTPVKATSANTGDAGVLLYGVTAALSLTGTAWLGAKSRKH